MKENVFIKDKLKKITIAKFLKKKLKSAGFIDVEIVKTSFNTRIVIYALKPGFVIGKKGENIRALTSELEKKFDFNKIHIEIGEIPNKNLDPKVIIEDMENNITKGIAWKRVVYGAMRKIKESGAIGAEIIAKGNTSGKGQRKRKSRFAFGYMKKAGDQKDLVDYEKKTTFPGLGTIGIKLRIVKPDILFTDKVDVEQLAKEYKVRLEEKELEKRKEDLDKKDNEIKEEIQVEEKPKKEIKKKTTKKAEEKPKTETKTKETKTEVTLKAVKEETSKAEEKTNTETKEVKEEPKEEVKEDAKK